MCTSRTHALHVHTSYTTHIENKKGVTYTDNMNNQQTDIRQILYQRLEEAKLRNPRFSLRAFARQLNLPLSTLSMALGGHRQLSIATQKLLSEKLMLDPVTTSNLLQKRNPNLEQGIVITAEQFRAVSDSDHWVVMNLLRINSTPVTSAQLAKQFSRPVKRIEEICERLAMLGVVRLENETWTLIKDTLHTPEGISSTAIRKCHTQGLEQAKWSLDNDDIAIRDFASLFLAIQQDDVPILKREINSFLRRMMKLARKPNRNCVYRLQIQAFPLTPIQKTKSKTKTKSKGNSNE